MFGFSRFAGWKSQDLGSLGVGKLGFSRSDTGKVWIELVLGWKSLDLVRFGMEQLGFRI